MMMMMRFLKGRVQLAGCLIRFVLLFRHAMAYIPTSPKNTVAFLGKKVILECTTNLSRPVRWKVNSEIIYYNEIITESLRSKYRIETSSHGTYNLVIDKVDLSHAGIYRCITTFYPGEREEGFSAQLTVLESEPVCDTNTSSLSSDGVEGDVIRLACTISFAGCGRPVMDWHKSNGEDVDGLLVILNETTILATSSLIIQLNSSGNDIIYSCHIYFSLNSACSQKEEYIRAKNIPDFQNIWNYTANILYGPRNIRIYPKQTEYKIGDRITCSADGNPSPVYEWTEIGNGSREYDGPVLTIDETMVSDHERNFRCTATNVVAQEKRDVSETVIVNATGNRLRRVVQTNVLIALPIFCSVVLFALAVYLLIRFRKIYWTAKITTRFRGQTNTAQGGETGEREAAPVVPIVEEDYYGGYVGIREVGAYLETRPESDHDEEILAIGGIAESAEAAIDCRQIKSNDLHLREFRYSSYVGADGTEYMEMNGFRPPPTTNPPILPRFTEPVLYASIDHSLPPLSPRYKKSRNFK